MIPLLSGVLNSASLLLAIFQLSFFCFCEFVVCVLFQKRTTIVNSKFELPERLKSDKRLSPCCLIIKLSQGEQFFTVRNASQVFVTFREENSAQTKKDNGMNTPFLLLTKK